MEKLEEFYTAEELAHALKLNVMTIYRYIKNGTLSAYKIGKEYRIDHKEFQRFLENARAKQSALSENV
jgi:excisionase family DNA binding protein